MATTSQNGYNTGYATPNAGEIRLSAPNQHLPGPIGRRFVASLIDGVIHSVLIFPVNFIFGVFFGATNVSGGGQPNSDMMMLYYVSSYVASFIVAFFYYGWFYSNKGATPGKMMMKLRVSHSETGTNLSYGRAFLREVVGKILSAIILMIGFLMAAVRDDRRALHDLLFSTRVTYEP